MMPRLRKFARTRYDRERVSAFLEFTWHRFLEDRCMQTAGALSFTAVFALVPLTAAILGILAAFPGFAGWREQITQWVFDNFVPAAGSTVQGYITQFADNASKATAVGVLVLLASSISLMTGTECLRACIKTGLSGGTPGLTTTNAALAIRARSWPPVSMATTSWRCVLSSSPWSFWVSAASSESVSMSAASTTRPLSFGKS